MRLAPFPPDALRVIRKIIVHKQTATEPCADGRASALVLHAALPDVPIVEMAYGDPDHEALQPEPGLLFCDFSPPKGRLVEFVCAGGYEGFIRGEPGAMVLDHHESRLVAPFCDVGLGLYGDNARCESGAVLAFQVFRGLVDPLTRDVVGDVAMLAAIRDTWQTMSPRWDEACAMTMALRLPSLEKLLSMPPRSFFQFAEDAGPMLVQSKQDSVHRTAESALWMRIGEVQVAVVPSLGLASDAADLLAPCGADLVVGFGYVHERLQAGQRIRLQFSLRSRGKVNATALAAHLGGGGHENGRAAGFRLAVHTGVGAPVAAELNPYARLERLLVDALSDPAVRARVLVGPS